MKIVFFGTPAFAIKSLDQLINANHEMVCVYCQPPKAAGRGQKIRYSAVHERAKEMKLMVRHPTNFFDEHAVKDFLDLDADIGIVVAYGLILPQKILEGPKLGCLNIHASLLPRWRGAAPIQRAIIAGDRKTGVSIMKMDTGLDTGSILFQSEIVIGDQETAGGLHDKLAILGANAIVSVLRRMNELTGTPQTKNGVTYAKKIQKKEGAIDWKKSAEEVDSLIRGLSPFPGAWTLVNNGRLKILDSQISNMTGAPGEHLGSFTIACGEGAVSVTRVQKPGKRVVTAKEFLRGNNLPEVLG